MLLLEGKSGLFDLEQLSALNRKSYTVNKFFVSASLTDLV